MTFHAILIAGSPESGFIAFRRDATADIPIRRGDLVDCLIRRGEKTPALVCDVTLGWDPVMLLWTGEQASALDRLWTATGWEPVQVLRNPSNQEHRFYVAPASPQDEPLLILPVWDTPPADWDLSPAPRPAIGFSRPPQARSPLPALINRSLADFFIEDTDELDTQNANHPDESNTISIAEWRARKVSEL